jgi:ABC-type sulfate transport system permease component
MLRKFELSLSNTSLGFVILVLALALPFLGVIAHCSYNIYIGNGLDTYDLIVMDHPVLTNLGVSYLEVLIADVATLVAVFVGILMRYNYYKDERDFIKKYNLNVKTGFSRDFKNSGSSGYDRGASFDD